MANITLKRKTAVGDEIVHPQTHWDQVTGKPSTFTPTGHNHDTLYYKKTEIDGMLSSAYKAAGSLTATGIVSGLLVAANEGKVYNISESFTTNSNFVDAASKTHPAGTNIVVIKVGASYKFDVLSGFVDLSSYVLSSDSRLTNARPASDVYSWAKAASKPSYTYSEVGAAASSHSHSAGDITSGTIAVARLPLADYSGSTAGIVKKMNSLIDELGDVDGSDDVVTGRILYNVLNNTGYITAGHTHAASAITSGTLDIARIPTGTTSSTVAKGDHTHSNYISTTIANAGVLGRTASGAGTVVRISMSDLKTALAITPANIGAAAATHAHSAGDITSGTIAVARLPLADYSGSTAGIVTVENPLIDELGDVHGSTNVVTGRVLYNILNSQFVTKASAIGMLKISSFTGGVLTITQ